MRNYIVNVRFKLKQRQRKHTMHRYVVLAKSLENAVELTKIYVTDMYPSASDGAYYSPLESVGNVILKDIYLQFP